MITQEERKAQKKAQNDESHKEQLWSKPANDIITGIECNDSVPPERAIWELVQNAHDVSYDAGTNIEFERHTDKFVFMHDGRPFEINNLNALNIQTSSKVRNSIIQIGQYGTGFLTTHKFGLKFSLDSSLMYIITDNNGEEVGRDYHNFSGLLFDRSSHDKKVMRDRLEAQHDEISSIQEKFSVSSIPSPTTRFTYYQYNEIERVNTKLAFENAESLAIYVMSLNKRINSISFRDYYDDDRIVRALVIHQVSSEYIEDNDLWKLERVDIEVTKNDVKNVKHVFILHSKKSTENGEPIVSIILPIIKEAEDKYDTFDLGESIPRLFLKLPLIGTETWGVNYIFNSTQFSCENDSRNSVRFVGNGQNNDDFAENNRNIIAEGQRILFDFIENTTLSIADKRHLAHINFDINNRNEKLAEYYSQLKKGWIEFFKYKSFFPTNKKNIGNVNCAKFLSSELQEACKDNVVLLDAVYTFAEKIAPSYEHLPIKEDLLFWSKLISEWMPDEPMSFFISTSQIIDYLDNIANHNLATFDLKYILEFDKYLLSISANCFNSKCLIPNENGIGLLQSALKDPEIDNPTLRLFLNTFLPEQTVLFVNSQFKDLTAYSIYGLKEVKESISNLNSELITQFSKASTALKNKGINDENISTVLLTDEKANVLLKFLGLFASTTSEAFRSKIMALSRHFYNISESETEVDAAIKDALDWRNSLRVLINDVLLKVSMESNEDKTGRREWIFNIVQTLFLYKDYQDLLRYYPLYLNQSGLFTYYDQVKKPDEMPEALKSYYDTVVLKGSSSIKAQLVDLSYAPYLIEPKDMKGIELAEEINKEFLLPPYPNLAKSPYKNHIIEIVTSQYSESDQLLWARLFTDLFKDKAILLLSIIESPSKKESLTRLMTIDDDEKLQKIVELTETENLDLIIQLGQEALASREREGNDFAYKSMLGSYVEELIQKELELELGEGTTACRVEIDNEQGGQDLVVYVNNNPVYFIEIKSRWNKRDSVLMSKMQMDVSAQEKNRYALIVADMSDFPREKAERHEYPSDITETLRYIRIAPYIGTKNQKIVDSLVLDEEDVHLGGDYKSVVPQTYLNSSGLPFEELIKKIKEIIFSHINDCDKS